MPDCEYCEQSFEAEAAYLDHLAAEHADELGPIDRRRLEARESGDADRDLTGVALILAGAVILGGVYLVFFSGVFSDGGGTGNQPLPERGDATLLADVQQYEVQSRTHVSQGTDIDYDTSPPVGGPHYGATAQPGFYEERPPLGELVHNLEHGHVVVYYDPDALSPDARESLEGFASTYDDTWAAVLVVPHPDENPDSPYVLTAWGAMLEMDSYDAETVRAFLAEYIGRGPERQVR